MERHIRLEHLKSFTPCQYEVKPHEKLLEVKGLPDEIFDVQAANIQHILSNALDFEKVRDLSTLPFIPEQTLTSVYETIAQKEVEKGMQNLKGTKFNIDYDDVPDIAP